MAAGEISAELRDEGVVLLRGLFAPEALAGLCEAAGRCFAAIEAGGPVPERYRFSRAAHSVLLTALLDYGIESREALLAPLCAEGLGALYSELVGSGWRCRLEHSWARRKFAPRNAPAAGYHMQDWHQDGALGVQFPPRPGTVVVPTVLAVCWIPLNACGRTSPGLEFIRRRPPGLLHYTELNDAALRQRFEAEAFWAPALELGDAVVFRNDILHRTHAGAEMEDDRMSVEYRIFPAE
jgi:hypothetical protein